MNKNKNLVPTDLLSSKKFEFHLHIKNPDNPLAMLLKGMKPSFESDAIPISIPNDNIKLVVAKIDRDIDLLSLIIDNYDVVLIKGSLSFNIKTIFDLLEVF